MAKFTRRAHVEAPSTRDGRMGKLDVTEVYTDEQFNVFTIVVSKEEYSPERVKMELESLTQGLAGAGTESIEIP